MTCIDPATFTIRPAQASDASRLTSMRYQFRSELAPVHEREDGFGDRFVPWLLDRLNHPAWRIWVATDGPEQIVGHIFLHFIEKVPNPVIEAETIAYITNAYVLPDYRNQGLGARLLQTALAACSPEQVDTIILWPSEQSRALYLRAGFQLPATLLEQPLRTPNYHQ